MLPLSSSSAEGLSSMLIPSQKPGISHTSAKRTMASLASYYMENPDEAYKWRPSHTEHLSYISPSISSGSLSLEIFHQENPILDSVGIPPSNVDNHCKLSSLQYFSKVIRPELNLKKVAFSKPLTNLNESEDIYYQQGAQFIQPDAIIHKCKAMIGLDLSCDKNYPLMEDIIFFKDSFEKVQTITSRSLNLSFEEEIRTYSKAFYSSISSQPTDNQSKLPHFISDLSSKNRPFLSSVLFGDIFMDVWHSSPFPLEYIRSKFSSIWICPYCLKYCNLSITSERHKLKCSSFRPPGKEIHRQANLNKVLSIFEVDGSKHKLYCQNLCLLAKCFLDHKILYYDVNSFLFYILVESIDQQDSGKNIMRVVGYFSKERNKDVQNNISCIVIFPMYQGLGYGYLLTKAEGLVGGPETPLSELGFLSYSKYWKDVVVHELKMFLSSNTQNPLTWAGIERQTGIYLNHILSVLEWMECILRSKEGQIAIDQERLVKYDDVLSTKIRPAETNLKWLKDNKKVRV